MASEAIGRNHLKEHATVLRVAFVHLLLLHVVFAVTVTLYGFRIVNGGGNSAKETSSRFPSFVPILFTRRGHCVSSIYKEFELNIMYSKQTKFTIIVWVPIILNKKCLQLVLRFSKYVVV